MALQRRCAVSERVLSEIWLRCATVHASSDAQGPLFAGNGLIRKALCGGSMPRRARARFCSLSPYAHFHLSVPRIHHHFAKEQHQLAFTPPSHDTHQHSTPRLSSPAAFTSSSTSPTAAASRIENSPSSAASRRSNKGSSTQPHSRDLVIVQVTRTLSDDSTRKHGAVQALASRGRHQGGRCHVCGRRRGFG